ncbi:MAG: type IV pilus modification PilV family protein [Gemmatimonadaceae bacterium]
MRRRAGLTVIEIMVTILVLSVGMLGLLGTSALAAQMLAMSSQHTVAATLAQARLEALQGVACSRVAAGSAVSRGMTETWTTQRTAAGLEVTITVTHPARQRTRTYTYNGVLPC